jgi:hypothetical protein
VEEAGATQWCCGQGRFIPPRLPDLTAEFYDNEEFLRKSREYNGQFAFAALGIENNVPTFNDARAFYAVSGRIYSRVRSLADEHVRNNLTMYIHDPAMPQSRATPENLDMEVLSDIRAYMLEVNPFVESLRRLNNHVSENAYLRFEHTTRATHGPVVGDTPHTASQLAAVIDLADDQQPRSVVIWKVGQARPQYVSHLSPTYEALTYPLLFPHGSAGWWPSMVGPEGHKITLLRYTRCMLLSELRFHGLRRLSQEWLVDAYCRTKEQRLYWYSHNQDKLRIAERGDVYQVALRNAGQRTDRPHEDVDDPGVPPQVNEQVREDETAC